jgi:hypothetical protein
MPGHLTAVPTDATAGADLRKFLASHDVSTVGDRLSASPDLTSLTLIALRVHAGVGAGHVLDVGRCRAPQPARQIRQGPRRGHLVADLGIS